jgi:hypothetical protein
MATMTLTKHDTTTTLVFVEDAGQDLDPFHRAEQRRDALLTEPPESTATIGINERALDLATVTLMHSAGFADYTLLDAEETRRAIDEVEGGL